MARFNTTRWSLIAQACAESTRARPALEQLCRDYRPPVLAFLRSHGHSREDAEDLTQEFFARFLEQGWYAAAMPERGRFRDLLLTALRRFVHTAQARRQAVRRGGLARLVALDEGPAAPATDSPEAVFLQAWIGVLLARARTRLREEYRGPAGARQFDRLWACIDARADSEELDTLAREHGQRRNTVAVRLHRMRKRLRELVRLELLATVGSGEALEVELAELRESLGLKHAPAQRREGARRAGPAAGPA